MVAKAFQQVPRIAHGLRNFGVDSAACEVCIANPHPQTARRAADRIGMAFVQRRRGIGRAQIRASAGVEHGRRIAHRTGQEPVNPHARPAFTRIGTIGQARAGWLKAEQPARRRRNSHRPAAV